MRSRYLFLLAVAVCSMIVGQGSLSPSPWFGVHFTSPPFRSPSLSEGQWAVGKGALGDRPAGFSSLTVQGSVPLRDGTHERSLDASSTTHVRPGTAFAAGENRGVVGASSGSSNYAVTFKEAGLPSGTSWSIFIDGQTNTSSSIELNFSLPDGLYPVHAGYVAGYRTGKLANVTVYDAPVSVTVKFVQTTYTVAFVEKGLPKGAAWEVSLIPTSGPPINGSSVSATIRVAAPNGTFFYSISPVQGYKLVIGSLTGSLTVAGSTPYPIAVDWTAASSPKTGLSVLDYVAIAGVVLLAGVILTILWLRRRNRSRSEASLQSTSGKAVEPPAGGSGSPPDAGMAPPGTGGGTRP